VRRSGHVGAYMGRSLDATATAELVQLAKAGDQSAFEALLRPLLLPGYKLACTMLQDPAAAEDAVQEAALKSWRHLDQLRAGTDIQPWFFGVVANECRTSRRKRWWSVLTGYVTDGLGVTSDVRDVDQSSDVRRALLSLSSRARLIVVLHYYFDMPLEDIATVVRLKPAGVRSQLYRALAALKRSAGLKDLR
jgi:RNA polymerase sigma-70 factor, ECF subfamily